jgi:hypothetical protein
VIVVVVVGVWTLVKFGAGMLVAGALLGWEFGRRRGMRLGINRAADALRHRSAEVLAESGHRGGRGVEIAGAPSPGTVRRSRPHRRASEPFGTAP